MIPTTDEMDSITPAERVALIACCEVCYKWAKLKYDDGTGCKECGGKYIPGSAHTQRTFDADRAKKESKKYQTKAKARRR